MDDSSIRDYEEYLNRMILDITEILPGSVGVRTFDRENDKKIPN